MTPTAASIRARIVAELEDLNVDELEVLLLCAEGLTTGRAIYGPLRAATDRRSFGAEAGEELRDAMIYAAAGLLRLRAVRS